MNNAMFAHGACTVNEI